MVSRALDERLSCTDDSPMADYPAASSFLVAIWDPDCGDGFGASFGDSTLAVIRASENADSWEQCAANTRNAEFVNPRLANTLDPRRALEFAFCANPGDLVAAFTDGIDGCHYGFPQTSLTPAHLSKVWRNAGGDTQVFVRNTIQLALAGADGNPGGQDNIAMVVTLAAPEQPA